MSSLTDNLDDPSGTVWSIKPEIIESLYPHQQQGFEFLWKNLCGSTNLSELKTTAGGDENLGGGCIISHAPGTGKTRLAIAFVETYTKLFPNCCPMIIAPAGSLLTWEQELRKWNFDFPFINLNDDTEMIRMVNLYTWSQGKAVLGISYTLFEKLTTAEKAKDFRTILLEKPGLVILDEGHTHRNLRSKIRNALLKLRTQKRVILSGTPFQNNFHELFNTLHLVRPTIAAAFAQEKRWLKKNKNENSENQFLEVNRCAVERLKISMAPFVHVYKGTILQQSLPGLRDFVVVLKPPPLQKSLIEKLEEATLVSVHPYLFHHSETKEEERIGVDFAAVHASKMNPNEGGKTRFLLELVRLSILTNEKVLVFSQYIQPLNLINEHLKEVFEWMEGRQILWLQGKLDKRHRQNMINQFNDVQNESKVMLASTRFCSEGIGLVGASRVILLDVVWDPVVETQAISRAYRIGQKKLVYAYHLMTSGTTEADKYCREQAAEKKERVMSEMMEFTSSSSSNECCKEKVSEDKILGAMIDQANSKEMFDKIMINHPQG